MLGVVVQSYSWMARSAISQILLSFSGAEAELSAADHGLLITLIQALVTHDIRAFGCGALIRVGRRRVPVRMFFCLLILWQALSYC